MSPRIWTLEELNRVWPLPEGWFWERDGEPLTWDATRDDMSDSVFVCDDGTLDSMSGQMPIEVVLAVIGVHQGRDSVAAMVKHCDDEADASDANAAMEKTSRGALASQGIAGGLRQAATMLRRGTA